MGLPKKRITRTRRDKRRTHDGLTKPNATKCKHCGEPLMPHRACRKCGYYKGQQRLQKKAA